MTGNNPTDRSKLGTKRHILTDKNGIPLSVVISSASTHDIKLVTNVMDNMIIKRSSPPRKCNSSRKRKQQHLCLDKAYSYKTVRQAIIKRGYLPHIHININRGQKIEVVCQKKHPSAKNKRWVVERTNSWHNRFRKLHTRYEKKAENYLGLVQFSCCIIIYKKIILG
jgi:putative transposase